MSRVVAVALVVLVLTVSGQSACGEGDERSEPASTTPEQAADAVLAAIEAKDEALLRAVAAKDTPDPWLVADELLARGSIDAALAFAKAAPRPDVQALPAYIAEWRGRPDDAHTRSTLRGLGEALARKDTQEALDALTLARPETGSVLAVRIAHGRGLALRALNRMKESAKAFLEAAAGAKRLGWLARASSASYEGGASAWARSDFSGALAAWNLELLIEERRGDRASAAAALGNIGVVLSRLGNHMNALEYHKWALMIREELRDLAGAAAILGNIGNVYHSLGSYYKALEYHERALKVKDALSDPAGKADTLGSIGTVYCSLGNYASALEYYERALKTKEGLGDIAGVASALGNIGGVHDSLGNFATALEYYERSLKIKDELGDRSGIAGTLGNIGLVHSSLGNYAKALAYSERSLKLKEDVGDRAGAANALRNIGSVHNSLGNYATALECHERSLKLSDASGDYAGSAATIGSMGTVHHALGNYAKALGYQERALKIREELGNRAGVVASFVGIGNVYLSLGDYARALEYQEKALKVTEELGDRRGTAATLSNIGSVHDALGDPSKALEYEDRAFRAMEELGDTAGAAHVLGSIGNVHRSRGNHAKALEYYERALGASEELGDQAGTAGTLVNIGLVLHALEKYTKALEYYDRAVLAAGRLRANDILVRALWNAAGARLRAGDPASALADVHRAVNLLGSLVGRLGDEQGAVAREQFAGLFSVGVLAAVRAGSLREMVFILESGRAVTLLESLGGRRALRWDSLPVDLRRAEAESRTQEARAFAAYAKALDGADVQELRARDVALDAARERVRVVAEKIQRDNKREANLWYPRASSLEEIQGWLEPGDALVLWGLSDEEAHAVVLTRERARIVSMGQSADVEAACAALATGDPDSNPEATLSRLHDFLVKPLALAEGTRRLLVSPEGPLSYVPFAALVGEIPVTVVPSGTTYGLLLEDRAKRGVGVLALGDPDYSAERDATAESVYRGDSRLPRLPQTREEAKAIGDSTLLGRDASEMGLRAALAAKKEPWKAVHFACHGFVDPERPTLSSLVLSPDAENDGFLTALDVMRMKIPADLVVLSACETGKGKLVRGEGIVGLTRAFMFAGAPRVIVSLWKVDDEATRALMTKFYEEWKAGTPTATALMDAQGFVRSRGKWKHPYYWAAWQLWGLAD